MAAPTHPLSAFTDGLDHTWYALGWLTGALLPLLALTAVLALFAYTYSAAHPKVRRTVTAHRIRRSHRRYGR